MAKTVIKCSLSAESIRKAIQELEQYKKDLNRKIEIFTEKLAQRGVEVAKARVESYDAVFAGELMNSIHSEKKSSENGKVVFAIAASSSHAIFVEMGTGIIGQQHPYPYKLPDGVSWEYASGKTIRQLADGRYGWFYPLNGKWYFTEGMPSRPFMYETAMQLTGEVVKIAKEVFG